MRIATRLWLALLVVIGVVLLSGIGARRAEERLLVLDLTLRDRVFFAHALHAAIADHDRERALVEARSLLDREEVAQGHISARLVSVRGTDPTLPRPRLALGPDAPLLRGDVMAGVHGDEVLTYVPIDAAGSTALELAETQIVDLLLERVGWWTLVGQTLALAALAGLVTFALVGWLVGRPLQRLAVLARRLGAGDLAARVDVRGGDEVAVLATEMNHMAERLGAAQRAVEEADLERATALEQLRHADRLRTVGELSSELAHELGTPLNVVSGHARMIEEAAEPGSETHDSARVVLEQASRMTRILRDLLDFTRRRGARRVREDLRPLVARACRALSPIAAKQRVQVALALGDEPLEVDVDGPHFVQVVTNLLTNAMHAMPEGGEVRIALERRMATPPLDVSARGGPCAVLIVEDEGTGIDPADRPRIFEPFFTRKGEGEGTGLGLPVALGIVQEHGGWIDVRSALGEGSRFEVHLPLAPA